MWIQKHFALMQRPLKKPSHLKPKAIVPVHLYGQAAHMEEIMAIAQKHNLFVIEDNAQAIGRDYYFKDGSIKKTGTIGTIGCYLFFPFQKLGWLWRWWRNDDQ